MSSTTLVATPRSAGGSSAARRLRAEGHVPGVVYGQGMEPITVTVDRRDLRLALGGPGGTNTLLSLEVAGRSYPVVVKDLQRHPIKRTVSHIDFLQVDLKVAITVQVPVRLEGEAKAVINAGGLVDAAVDTVEVSCTPGNMPAEIVIDISAMQPGDIIRLGDITLPKGVTATAAPETAVVTILQTSGGPAAPEAAPVAAAAEPAAE
ncbi:MAG: 50S ribosomal protein L25 [Ilumatobacteraceae bacterium]